MTKVATSASNRTLVDHVAYLVSILFSPFLILPALLVAVTWRAAATPAELLLWTAVAVGFFTLIPLLYVAREVQAGRITDLHIMVREQRNRVFWVVLVSVGLGIVVYSLLGVPDLLLILSLVIFTNALLITLITLAWKISVHSWVIAGAIAAFALLSANSAYWWLLVIVPLVIWARLHRHRHSPAQGIAGASAGIAVTWLLYWAIGV